MGVETALIVTALAAGASAYTANRQKKQGDELRAKQQEESDAMVAEANKQKTDQEGIEAATATRDAARKRQQQLMTGGRQSTILTSPMPTDDANALLGTSTTPNAGKKTILGA